MTSHELCASPNQAIFISVAMVFAIGVGILALTLRHPTARPRRVRIFVLIVFLIGGSLLAGTLHKDPHFLSYSIVDGQVTLGFAWPGSSVTLPAAQLKEVRAEHGVARHRRRNGSFEVSDIVWIDLVTDGASYRSCHQASPEQVTAAARDLAAAAHVAPAWSIHCEDGHEVASSAEEIGRGGSRWESELAPRCK